MKYREVAFKNNAKMIDIIFCFPGKLSLIVIKDLFKPPQCHGKGNAHYGLGGNGGNKKLECGERNCVGVESTVLWGRRCRLSCRSAPLARGVAGMMRKSPSVASINPSGGGVAEINSVSPDAG